MKKRTTSIRLNFLMNIILTMSSFIFPLITFPYVSRVLLPEGNGKMQVATSFISYFLLISQLGIPTYGIRICASVRDSREKLSKTVQELFFIQMCMTIIAYLLLFICVKTIPQVAEERTLYMVLGTTIILNTLGMEWLFKALEEYTYITIRSIIFKVISVVAMFFVVRSSEDYLLYASITVVASAGANLLNLSKVHSYIDWKKFKDYHFYKHIKPILVLFAYTCATTIYTNIDSVMLGFMTSNIEVGYYGVAIKIKNILVSVITALGAVMLPRVSYYYENGDMDTFWSAISKSMRFVVMISLPLAIYFMIFAESSIVLISGEEYIDAVSPMVCIMPTIILIGITYVLGMQILIPMGKESTVLFASVVAAVVNVIVNMLLIPSLKSTGAAVGTLIAEIVVLVILGYVLRKKIIYLIKECNVGLKIIACIVAAGLSSLVHMWELENIKILVLSTIIFFGVYVGILRLGKDELICTTEKQVLAYIYKLKAKMGYR